MKNLETALIAALVMTACTDPKFTIAASDVPPVIIASFEQKYPGAEVKEWEVEKEEGRLVYEVGFKFKDKKIEAAFKPDGTFMEEE